MGIHCLASVVWRRGLLGATIVASLAGCEGRPRQKAAGVSAAPRTAAAQRPWADPATAEPPGIAAAARSDAAAPPGTALAADPGAGRSRGMEQPRPVIAAVDRTANAPIQPGDWPQWGGTSYRNNTPVAAKVPMTWNVGEFDHETGAWAREKAKNIKWVARLGGQTYGTPVIAGGRVFVGTNNQRGYLKRYPASVDLGCLLCFRESDGELLWQHSSEKLPKSDLDWPEQGICCAPLVEGNRLWFVSSRGHVVCLDAEGFHDGEDDGPVKNAWGRLFDVARNEVAAEDQVAPSIAALDSGRFPDALRSHFQERGVALPDQVAVHVEEPGKRWGLRGRVGEAERQFHIRFVEPQLSVFQVITPADRLEADTVWDYDMMKEQGVLQHNMCSCSVTAWGDTLFVSTSNGVDGTESRVPAPHAPSFMAMDKHTGKVIWTDNTPGENILHGQWSSPAAGLLGGVPQVLFAGGDGYLYSFRADRSAGGKPELLWKFDTNPKQSKWLPAGRGDRNEIIATPVIYDGLVYVAVGQDPESGEGKGHLWCIDPTKRGDVSPQLAMRVEGDRKVPIPHRREQAVIPEQGEIAVDNPDSAAVWHYGGQDQDGDGEIGIEETMHRCIGTVAIKDDLLFVADFSGIFHCVDAKTGRAYWSYDLLASAWGSPLIAGDHVYIGDEDGEVCVFRLSPDPEVAMKGIDKNRDGKIDRNERYPLNANEEGEPASMGNSLFSTPVVANGVLFISSRDRLFAIQGR